MASVETMRVIRLIYYTRRMLTVHLLFDLLVEHHSSVVDGAEANSIAVETAIALEVRGLTCRFGRRGRRGDSEALHVVGLIGRAVAAVARVRACGP